MVEITVRDASPADVPFLRDALAKLNDEMETLCGATGFGAEGFPGLNSRVPSARQFSHRGCRRGAARFPVDLPSVSVTTEHWFGPDRWQ